MDKSLFLFTAVGIGFLYFVTNFIGNIQKEDEQFSNSEYNSEHKYDKYMGVNAIGQSILVLTDIDKKTQLEAWNKSSLKKEFFDIFPDFGDMKEFVKNRIKSTYLQKKLLDKINEVEGKFFSGSLTTEDVKRELNTLK
ncbi:MAG: hypothetical protein L3J43_08555 [Sulfurovum sp.]|nr:hypothetical protein [Sulfurovum sp.]